MQSNKVHSKDFIIEAILDKMGSMNIELSSMFHNSKSDVGIRFFYIDNLLPDEIVHEINMKFPAPEQMRLMKSIREFKRTSKSLEKFPSLITDITFAFQDPRVIKVVENITGIYEQVGDPNLYAGGLSLMGMGHFLGPHLDNSHNFDRSRYRALNLLYYVTPEWQLRNGGNLELWDKNLENKITIESKFNRLVVMETTPLSWHSVSKISVSQHRKCVSNYYFSKNSPTGAEYFNVTSFSAPKTQPLMRIALNIDGKIRGMIRRWKSIGIGRVDLYNGLKQK